MLRRPPRIKLTGPLFPYASLYRSVCGQRRKVVMRCIFKKRPDGGETCIAASDAVASAFLISLEALIYKEKCRNGETERSVAICTRRQQSFFTEPSVDRRSKHGASS